MRINRGANWLFVSAVLVVLAAVAVIFYFAGQFSFRTNPQKQSFEIGFGSDTFQAVVLDIMEEGLIDLGETRQPYQILLIKIIEGPMSGQLAEIDYGKRQIRPPGLSLTPGDKILVTVSKLPDGSVSAFFTDFMRTKPLLWLAGTFILFTLIISGWKGARSLLGLGFSLIIITSFIIPQILNGRNPVLVSISGSFVMLAVTLYLTYGWNLKTHAAIAGTLIALLFTGFLSTFFVNLTRLTGFGSEDALFLIQQSDVHINLRGLVLGGMLIGALGVLDDLVITQSSAVIEIYLTDMGQKWYEVFRRAIRIGQDHVAATVNTLVLAYAGAALPTMLLFSLSGESFVYLINLEFITEEIVRTLVGSLGLIAAVPLTTILAVFITINHRKIHNKYPFLGPITNIESVHRH